MEEPRAPRYRGAVEASLVILALLLFCQAAVPVNPTHDRRLPARLGGGAAEDGRRRLGWWDWWGAGGVSNDRNRGGAVEPRKGQQGMVSAGGREDLSSAGRKAQAGRPDAGGRGRKDDLKKAMHPVGPKVPNVPISETVDLVAPGKELLWQPTTMTPPECPSSGDADGCDATVRFCLVKIGEYQEAPWKYPMAVMLQRKSECNKSENLRAFRLSALRAYMREHPQEFLRPNGFVYHETRTGSTLVANMLAHVPSNLVVSENNVAEDPARNCKQCSDAQKVSILRDMLMLFGNARSGHEHLFFKFQDSTTLKLVAQAFPDVGWVYLFRDPVEVMVSNLKGAYGKRDRLYHGFDFDAAVNNSTASHEPNKPSAKPSKPLMSPCLMASPIGKKGRTREEICADRLKTLCQAAVDQLEGLRQGEGRGAVVEYTSLPDVVTDFIYPELFAMGKDKLEEHLPYISEAARMYSKSMAKPETEFTQGADASYKQVLAEKAYKDAAETTGLLAVYRSLQGLQTWHKHETR